MNSCNTGIIGVPVNFAGYQEAKSGEAYMHLALLYSSNPDGGREYIEVELLSPLRSGEPYCVSFFVSKDESVISLDRIGIYFSNDSLLASDNDYINVSPHIENQEYNIITDTINWTKIEGIYVAGGGERFLTIGNFYAGSNTHTDTLPVSSSSSYYIDDVSVYWCGTTDPCGEINPNPNNGEFIFKYGMSYESIGTVEFFDAFGRYVDEYPLTFGEENELPIALSGQASGVYIWRMKVDGQVVCTNKFIISR